MAFDDRMVWEVWRTHVSTTTWEMGIGVEFVSRFRVRDLISPTSCSHSADSCKQGRWHRPVAFRVCVVLVSLGVL